jgi:hypothetical protein
MPAQTMHWLSLIIWWETRRDEPPVCMQNRSIRMMTQMFTTLQEKLRTCPPHMSAARVSNSPRRLYKQRSNRSGVDRYKKAAHSAENEPTRSALSAPCNFFKKARWSKNHNYRRCCTSCNGSRIAKSLPVAGTSVLCQGRRCTGPDCQALTLYAAVTVKYVSCSCLGPLGELKHLAHNLQASRDLQKTMYCSRAHNVGSEKRQSSAAKAGLVCVQPSGNKASATSF